MSFGVVSCNHCSNTWLLECQKREVQATVRCPHCGTTHNPRKIRIRASHEDKAIAAELRSRIEAIEAGNEDVYNRFVDEKGHGQYDEQQRKIEQRLEAFRGDDHIETPDRWSKFEDLVDLTPIERDRFGDLVDDQPFYTDVFGDAVDDRLESADAFADVADKLLEGFAERPDPDDLPRGEVTPTDQTLASAMIELDEDTTISDVWERLFDQTCIREALAESIRQLLAGVDAAECYDVLEDEYIPYWLRSPIVNAARGDSQEAWRVAADIIPSLHEHPLSSIEDWLAVATLFGAAESNPSIAAVVHEGWLDQDRRDREPVCHLLAVLAANLDVRVTSSGIVLRKLADEHRLDLPGVNDWCNQIRSDAGFADLVNEAVAALDYDSREVAVLRTLYEEDGNTLSYGQLYASFQCGDSRIRQCITELSNLDLVNRFGPRSDRMVEILEAGTAVLEAFDKEIARQRRLESFVSSAGQSRTKGRVNTCTGRVGEEPPEEPPAEATGSWKTTFLGDANHAAVVGSTEDGSVTLVPGGINEEHDHTRWVSYDPNHDEVVVAVRAADPTTYVASSAIALTWPTLLEKVFDGDRLENLDDPPIIVREARCIGGATDDALEDRSTFLEKLVDWGKEIGTMTRKLKHGEYGAFDSREAFRSEILRKSHGLFGTMAHLLDAVGVDLIREIRVPPRADKERQLSQLAQSVAVSAAIQSTYKGVFAGYRQLFETREEKRERALVPSVDAKDPYGSLIGSIAIRGPDIHRLEPYLRTRLEQPAEEHDDALEIAVTVPITSVSRDHFAETTARVLSSKNLRPTPAAVSLLHGLVESPHDAAAGLYHRLREEDTPREIRPDEIRRVLAGVDTAALCPDLPRSVGPILLSLLTAREPLSRAELSEQAAVSEKTISRHEEKLEALGIIEITEDGYRLELSFPTTEERREPVLPETVTASTLVDPFTTAVDELLETVLPPDRYADPSDPLGGILWHEPTPADLLEHDDLGDWATVASKLTGSGCTDRDPQTAAIGPGPETIQEPLPTNSEVAA